MQKISVYFSRLGFLLLSVFVLLGIALIPVSKAEAAGAQIPQSFFLEHPYSETSVSATGEWIDLDSSGNLWMNQYRVDLNLYQNLFGVYAKLPFSGVTSFGFANEDDYDIGNLGLGAKFVLVNMDNSVLTVGFETIIPTAGNDAGAVGALNYFRDFPYFLDDTVTLKPYVVFGASSGIFAIQANMNFDILVNADQVEGDNTELLLNYGGTASMTPELNLPFKTSFLVEAQAVSSTSFDNNITGVYITPGIRVGGQVLSLGAGLEIPFGSNEVSDFSQLGVVVDMQFRFGS